MALTLATAVARLREHYGRPEAPPTSDAFGLILWENAAYLASPARRREAFDRLTRTVGTSPRAILRATPRALEDVTARGILKHAFATKLRDCARIALDDFGGDLETLVRGPLAEAKRALQSFPGIGVPGAEKILLFTGHHPFLAPDSNALRVLVRLGLVREQKSYARTYEAHRTAAAGLPARPRAMQEAHLLLQLHGQTLCKRTAPRCRVCPLVSGCAYARRDHRQRRG